MGVAKGKAKLMNLCNHFRGLIKIFGNWKIFCCNVRKYISCYHFSFFPVENYDKPKAFDVVLCCSILMEKF